MQWICLFKHQILQKPEHGSLRIRAHLSWRTGNISMFSTCSELTPRAPIPDGRMERIMQPCPWVYVMEIEIIGNWFVGICLPPPTDPLLRSLYSHNLDNSQFTIITIITTNNHRDITPRVSQLVKMWLVWPSTILAPETALCIACKWTLSFWFSFFFPSIERSWINYTSLRAGGRSESNHQIYNLTLRNFDQINLINHQLHPLVFLMLLCQVHDYFLGPTSPTTYCLEVLECTKKWGLYLKE